MLSAYGVRQVHATAPIRIADNGGWTDTWAARHGYVFNIAVRPPVEVRLDVHPRGARAASVTINAENFGVSYAPVLDGPGWGPHPLLEAAVRTIPPPREADVEITVRSDVPAGAATGTSASVVVAMLGALDRLSGGRRSVGEIAALAHAVETDRLGLQSGIQDQICAARGGINFIEITEYPKGIASGISVSDSTVAELNRRLALIFMGHPHRSSDIHERVMQDLQRMGPDCEPLRALRRAAIGARDAVAAGDIEAFGAAMRDNTEAQRALNPQLVSADAGRVIEIAAAHGASGWKINGAGGDGGSITLLDSGDAMQRRAMLDAIVRTNLAIAVIPIEISPEGLTVETQD